MNQEYYWHIELYSGEIVKVKPDATKIQYIQKLIGQQSGAITTPTRSIVVKDIKDFRLSDEPYTDQKLIEDAAQAFKEPIITEESIACKWVKKSIPRRRWDTYYRSIPSYHLLYDNEAYVVMAFVMPIHQIDHAVLQELSLDEENRMAKKESWR